MIMLFVILTVILIVVHGFRMVKIAVTGKVPADGSYNYAARRLGMRKR